METIKIELGEEVTLKAADVLKDKKSLADKLKDADCRWHVAGGAVAAASDLEDDDTLLVVGAQVGRSRISYGPALSEAEMGTRERFAATEPSNQVEFDVEVTEVREKEASQGSSKFNGLLPMDEVQEGPSERTPYGMDQENKPVAPFAGMVMPDDYSTVARQSETAEAGDTPEVQAEKLGAEPEKKEKTKTTAAAKPASRKVAATAPASRKK